MQFGMSPISVPVPQSQEPVAPAAGGAVRAEVVPHGGHTVPEPGAQEGAAAEPEEEATAAGALHCHAVLQRLGNTAGRACAGSQSARR